MPEGHMIHRISRDHTKWFVGQKTKVVSPQGRFAYEAELINGKKLRSIEAYGKHLFYKWDDDLVVHIHLGLYGKFRSYKLPEPEPKGQVRVRLIGKERGFDLNGPNTCHLLSQNEANAVIDRLGPDPLRPDSDPEIVWERIKKSRAAVGSLLLNQNVISGPGNIYRSEVLHLLNIHPEKPGKELTRAEFDNLWNQLKSLLEIGVRYNRIIIATPEELGKTRSRMNRKESLLVYKHDRCKRCTAKIKSWDLAARTVYACPKCQKR